MRSTDLLNQLPDRVGHVTQSRHYAPAVAALALASFNLICRLGRERLTKWDEGLYATTAVEMLESGNWIATTSGGVQERAGGGEPDGTMRVVACRLSSQRAQITRR